MHLAHPFDLAVGQPFLKTVFAAPSLVTALRAFGRADSVSSCRSSSGIGDNGRNG